MRPVIVLFLGLLLFKLPIFAQQSGSTSVLNQGNGLSSNYVYDVFEDKRGFIWLATDGGLYRYDGFEYKLYASEMQSSLAGSCIQEDIYGRLWYENFDGYLFYIEKDKLNHINQDNPIQFLPYGLTEKHLYVIVKGGVNIYDLKSFELVKSIKIDWIYAEHASLIDGTFYITDQDKIVAIDENFNVLRTSVNVRAENGVKIVSKVRGKVAVFYRNGSHVNFYDKHLNHLYQNKINLPGTFHHAVSINRDYYNVATSQGIYVVDFGNDAFKIISTRWPGVSVAKSVIDRNDNEWIPTVGNGVFFNSKLKSSLQLLQKGNFTFIRPHNSGFVAVDAKGSISKLTDRLVLDKELVNAKSDVAYIFNDQASNSFFYTNNTGLFVVNKSQRKHYNVALKQAVRLDDKFYLVAASGFYGLFKNPFSKQTTSIWDKYFTKNIFNYNDFSAFKSYVRAKTIAYNENLKLIVAGTNIGTFINKQGVEQELQLNGKALFVNKLVWCENVLFALTTSGDLYKIENLEHFTKIDIPENGLRLAKHAQHTIYMLGSNFLYAYDTEKETISKFDLDLNTNSINDYLIEGQYIILATTDGLIKMNLKTNTESAKEVPFYINDFYANGVKTTSLADLAFEENNLRVNFSYLNYGHKNGVVIYYRLNQDAWIAVNEKERDVYFQALAPGKYVLRFKVNGKEVDEKVIINIAVPIWKAWWFYLILLSLIITSLAIYFTAKTKLYTREIKLLNEKIDLEKSLGKSVLTSIKAQMNPHFFYNALNTIQAFIFTNDKLSANNYLAKFSKLTRLVLEMSEKEIVGLNEEIDSIKMYLDLEKMRFGKKIDYQLLVENIPNPEMIELPPMLVQPLVENAVKHGLLHLNGLGFLKITYRKNGDLLIVEVDDNGIGREKSATLKNNLTKKHDSFAIKANQTRLDILNAGRADNFYTLEIIDKYEREEPIGTTARLTIPLT